MKMDTYTVVIEKGEDGYFIASVPAIPKCHTQGKTVEQAMERIREAIQLCLEEEPSQGYQLVGIQSIEVPPHGKTSPSEA
ncbi:MAG: type II toxin-antitoxin system HicB family antitoxin [Candidatus Micrarchaeota archaeon]